MSRKTSKDPGSMSGNGGGDQGDMRLIEVCRWVLNKDL